MGGVQTGLCGGGLTGGVDTGLCGGALTGGAEVGATGMAVIVFALDRPVKRQAPAGDVRCRT